VGLVYENNVLRDILAPAKRGIYWQTKRKIEVKNLILDQVEVPPDLAKQLRNPNQAIFAVEVADGFAGFISIDGKIQEMRQSGYSAWWLFNHKITVHQLDLRLQSMDIGGQEILTKDRVSLRINLFATWQVIDASKVIENLKG